MAGVRNSSLWAARGRTMDTEKIVELLADTLGNNKPIEGEVMALLDEAEEQLHDTRRDMEKFYKLRRDA